MHLLDSHVRRKVAQATCFVLWSLCSLGLAQNQPARVQRVTISGYVRDAESREVLPGLTIMVKGQSLGVVSNAYGYYALSLAPGEYTLQFSYVGYRTVTRTVSLSRDQTVDMELAPTGAQIDEVVIQAENIADEITSARMGVTRLSIEEIKSVPALFGEVDPLKVLQFLPGIKAGNEGTTGFFVRGGGSDQNLILLDDAPVYNASHIGGLFSIFSADAIQGMDVYKGNFPARYGGRLSSVLDVRLREGNQREYEFAGGVGLISSRFTAEGPIQREKSSFLISGRRTYVDAFTRIINAANDDDPNFDPIPNYYFYDLNVKANYEFSPRDRIYLSGYLGRDVFGFSQNRFSFVFDWGNITSTLRWNHVFGERLFSNTTLIFSDFDFTLNADFGPVGFGRFSGIRNWIGKVDFDWFPSPKHTVRFGVGSIYHIFTPSGIESNNSNANQSFTFRQRLYGNELSAYIQDDWDVTSRLRLSPGLRLSAFIARNKNYTNWEPRLDARYKLNELWAVKASAGRAYQYIHNATSSTASLPTDVWYPTTDIVRPQYADQIAAGVTRIFPDLGIVITNEFYYKDMRRQVELSDSAELFSTTDIGTEFVFGEGKSYGWELLIEKREGKTTGWIGYTWSRTTRSFPDLNDNPRTPEFDPREFPFRFDRRHDASLVVSHQISKRFAATLTFVYRTGDAVTIPNSNFFFTGAPGGQDNIQLNGVVIPGGPVPNYVDRNSFRMPATHRADFSITYQLRTRKWKQSELNLSIYNLYNNRNPYFFYIDRVEDANGNLVRQAARVVSLFPIIPSLTWNFKF